MNPRPPIAFARYAAGTSTAVDQQLQTQAAAPPSASQTRAVDDHNSPQIRGLIEARIIIRTEAEQ